MHSRRGFLSALLGVFAVLGFSGSAKASKKTSMLPDSVLAPWPDGFDPSSEYGRGREGVVHNSRHPAYGLKYAIREGHQMATKALPKGTQYELCIASTNDPNIKIVYWYYSPDLASIPSSRLAMLELGKHHFSEVVTGIETFGRFYA